MTVYLEHKNVCQVMGLRQNVTSCLLSPEDWVSHKFGGRFWGQKATYLLVTSIILISNFAKDFGSFA